MTKILFSILFLFPALVYGQLTVSAGTTLRVGDGGLLTTNGDVRNESDRVSFGAVGGLLLMGNTDQLLLTSVPLTLPTLSITNGSVKTIQGVIVVSQTLDLADGKIAVSGATEENALVVQNGATINENPDSWVIGSLVIEGQGAKLFPLGAGGRYAPVLLNIGGNENTLTRAAAFNGDVSGSITELPINIAATSTNWFWEIYGSDISGLGVTLPLQTEDETLIDGDDLIYSVLEVNKNTGTTSSLGGSQGTITAGINSVSSSRPRFNPNSSTEISSTYLLGVERTTVPVIHNILTPNSDGINDFLFIEAISVYGDDNEVIILDRWGTEVYRKKNFRNFNDTDNPYDGSFDFLDPGNYICIVTYAGQTAKQTITVLD